MDNSSAVSIQRSTYEDSTLMDCVQPLGGFSRFCSNGDHVVVKLNLLNASDPSEGVVTDPAVVKAVCEAVLGQKAIPVIGDSPSGSFTKRRLEKVYRKTGMLSLARDLGVEVNYDTRVVKVEIPKGKRLQKTSLCRFIHEADRVIALPKLKTHSLMMLTGASKIMFGAVPGLVKASYHSRFIRRDAFADMLLDVLSVTPVDLFVLDGVKGMQGDGPSGGMLVDTGVIMAATNAIAMDLAVCAMLGMEPVGIPVLKQAKIRGLWPADILYPLLTPSQVKYAGFEMPSTAGYLLTGVKKPVRVPVPQLNCTACGDCEKICPVEAISIPGSIAKVNYRKCIRCYCCHEVCAYKAFSLEKR